MALVVEDGTAKSTAEAYDTVANAQTYYDNRGYSETASEATVRRGTDALDARYRMRLKGYKSTSGQALAWPRNGVTDEDGNTIAGDAIPTNVKWASFELARAVSTALVSDDDATIRRVKAGSVEVEFADTPENRTILSHVNDLLAAYVKPTGRLVRA